jgi:two-component system, chemotaxis family, response regulator Rcp1
MEINKIKPVEILIIDRNPKNLEQLIEAFKYFKLSYNIRFAGNAEEALKMIFQTDEFKELKKPDIIISDIITYNKEVRWGILDIIAKREAIKCIPTVILSSLNEIENLEIQNCPNLLLPKPKTLEENQNVVNSIEKFWLNIQ